jgi:hypothetical protein
MRARCGRPPPRRRRQALPRRWRSAGSMNVALGRAEVGATGDQIHRAPQRVGGIDQSKLDRRGVIGRGGQLGRGGDKTDAGTVGHRRRTIVSVAGRQVGPTPAREHVALAGAVVRRVGEAAVRVFAELAILVTQPSLWAEPRHYCCVGRAINRQSRVGWVTWTSQAQRSKSSCGAGQSRPMKLHNRGSCFSFFSARRSICLTR